MRERWKTYADPDHGIFRYDGGQTPDASYNRVLRPRGCFRLHLRGKDAIIKMFRSKKISQTTQPFSVFPHLSVNAPERMKKTL